MWQLIWEYVLIKSTLQQHKLPPSTHQHSDKHFHTFSKMMMFLKASTKLVWPSASHKLKNTNFTLIWTIGFDYLAKQYHRWGRDCVEESRLCSCAVFPAGLLAFSSQHNTSLAYTSNLLTPVLLLFCIHATERSCPTTGSQVSPLLELFVTHWRNQTNLKIPTDK